MLDRVRRRAGTSGRSDDNDTTFAKRLIGFWSDTMPLVPYFQGKLQDRFIEVSFLYFLCREDIVWCLYHIGHCLCLILTTAVYLG